MAEGSAGRSEVTEGRLRFSPTIELGHLLQAIVMLGAVGGWALAGYFTIEKQLDQNVAEMTLFKQKLAAEESAIDREHAASQQSQNETRSALGKISDQISDLRVLVAGQGDGKQPHR